MEFLQADHPRKTKILHNRKMETIVPKEYHYGAPVFDLSVPYITINESEPCKDGVGSLIKMKDMPWKCINNGDLVDGKPLFVMFDVQSNYRWQSPEKPPKDHDFNINTLYVFWGMDYLGEVIGKKYMFTHDEKEIVQNNIDKIYKGLECTSYDGYIVWKFRNYTTKNLKICFQELK